jgi:alkylresorcinol/alkylpyrone synthase
VSQVVSVAPAFPGHRYPQQDITDAFAAVVLPEGTDRGVLDRLHRATGVSHRHLALPLGDYVQLAGFGAANDAFIEVGTRLGAEAIGKALAAVGLTAADVDVLVTTSVTGIAAPSLDARLVPVLGLRPDVRRVPVFGLGCVAGAAGVARVHDLLRGDPDAVAVLLSVELCSLTVQRDDASMANLVGSGLFGDGAAAVVMVGERRAEQLGLDGPHVLATRSRLYPDTERVMGWDIGSTGFRIVLSAGVPEVVEEYLGDDVAAFLGDHDLTIDDVLTWVAHPGGPKVLDAMQRALGLPGSALSRTWDSLAQVGNLSSSSVLHVLADTLAGEPPPVGSPGVLLAMGPGFCSELVLLQW